MPAPRFLIWAVSVLIGLQTAGRYARSPGTTESKASDIFASIRANVTGKPGLGRLALTATDPAEYLSSVFRTIAGQDGPF